MDNLIQKIQQNPQLELLVIGIIGIVVLYFLLKILKLPLKIIFNGIVGVVLLYLVNMVGAYFGISGPMYCLYENGDRRMRLEMLCALADLFGTSTDYLLGRTRNSKPYPKCKNQR